MAIVIDSPAEFANRNWVRFPAPGTSGEQLWHFTGNAVFGLKGTSTDYWRYEELIILPPESPIFSIFSQWAYTASPSSFYNAYGANHAGWAVDYVDLYANPGRAGIRCTVATRDTDGWLYRVAYHIVVVGRPT